MREVIKRPISSTLTLIARSTAYFFFLLTLSFDLTYINLVALSLCDSLSDLYLRTYDLKASKTHILPCSILLHDLLSSLKVSLPTSILYYFMFQTLFSDTYFTAIECAVKVALIRVIIGSLERWVVRQVAEGSKI